MEDESTPLAAVRWSWYSPVIILGVMVSEIINAVSDGVLNLTTTVASHSNYLQEQKDFEQEAAKAIERIVSE